MKKKILLVDISSFIFRAFFAIRRLTNPAGVPVNAVYGVTTMMLKLIEKEKPDGIICVFDTPAPSFRKEIYADYKANRGEPPDDLKPQFDLIIKAVDAIGISRVSKPGYEADDLIATLAKKFKNEHVVIVSGDKDLMQLVTDSTHLLDTMKDVQYGPKEVKEKLGVAPELVPDLLGLMGDASDNIPGVPGIGPKTAVELIEQYGSLEKVLEAIPSMKEGKRKTTLDENRENALLSKKLATVHSELTEAVADVNLESLKHSFAFSELFFSFMDEMGFKQLAVKYGSPHRPNELTAPKGDAPKKIETELTRVSTAAELEKALESLTKSTRFVMEPTISGERTLDSDLTTIQLSDGKKSFEIQFSNKLTANFGIAKIFKFLEANIGTVVIGFDLKKFARMALLNEIPLEKVRDFCSKHAFDLQIAHYVFASDEKHDLDFLIERFCGGSGGLFQATGLGVYFEIEAALREELKKRDLYKVFKEIEMPLVGVLAEIEIAGVRVDPDFLRSLSKNFAEELVTIEKGIFDEVGFVFNLNSPKQLSQVLFEKLKLPVITKTKTGFSTDAEVLQKLSVMHKIPEMILRYRELTKLKSTYVDVLPTLIEKDGRIHAKFNQAVAATGRLSSSDPNLQNIPVKTESGRMIRKAFIAEQGFVLVGADYSQIELRIVAHLSGDKVLLKAFSEGADIHTATAAEIFMVKPEEVRPEQRSAAKAINFGLIYGKSAFGLAQELNITRKEAQSYIDAYFKRYSGVKKYMDDCMQLARDTFESKTMFGRKRDIKDIASKNFAVRGNAERMAINTPVQGTAADIIKLAMIEVSRRIHEVHARFILQVHDEIVIEVPKDHVEKAKKLLKDAMENVVKLAVPMSVDAQFADNWMDL